MSAEKLSQHCIVGFGLRLRKVMTAAREGVQARACDLVGDDLAQRARHQDVVVGRNNQGWRTDVSKTIAGIMGEQRIDPRQHDIGRRMPGGLTRRDLAAATRPAVSR